MLPKSDDNDISSAFKKVIAGKKATNMDNLYKTKQKKGKKIRRVVGNVRDTENYIPYQSSDKHTEDGLAIHSFEQQARRAELSVTQEAQEAHYKPGQKKWDRIKKKMVSVENPRNGKIRTESGIWIPATYKTGRYSDWKEKNKIEEMVSQEMGEDCKYYCWWQISKKKHVYLYSRSVSHSDNPNDKKKYPNSRWERHNAKLDAKKRVFTKGKDNEMKTRDQIVRERMRLELIKSRERANKQIKDANRKRAARKQQKS